MMKRITILLFATVSVALCLSSCRKPSTPAAKGDSVLFSAGVGGSESASKAVYTDSNADDRKQAEVINWVAGDNVRIWCAECSEPTAEGYGRMDHCADYVVTPVEGTLTNANISLPSGAVGLRWGDPATTHNFYAVYPSPKTTGKGSDAGKFGTSSSFTFTGHIPSVQSISGNLVTKTDGDGKKLLVAAPDMANLYLVSKASADPNSGGEGVFLRFFPLSTAIQFTVENATTSDAVMKVENVMIMSDPRTGSAKNIGGAFDAKLSNTWVKPSVSGTDKAGIIYSYANTYPACSETAGATGQSTSISIDFSQTAAYTTGLSRGDRLQFTFFLMPTQSFDDLSFAITRSINGVSTTIKSRIELEGGTKVPFPVHKKTYVKGVLIPDSAQWIIQYSMDVNPWIVDPESPGYERIEME